MRKLPGSKGHVRVSVTKLSTNPLCQFPRPGKLQSVLQASMTLRISIQNQNVPDDFLTLTMGEHQDEVEASTISFLKMLLPLRYPVSALLKSKNNGIALWALLFPLAGSHAATLDTSLQLGRLVEVPFLKSGSAWTLLPLIPE
ncbi:hypothetical protein J6590_058694 [Homalodisca vitripennis]|nr:hypothetical protein J6590_058694 [Homalodisca vitripennis]